jgi:hypothetical protein
MDPVGSCLTGNHGSCWMAKTLSGLFVPVWHYKTKPSVDGVALPVPSWVRGTPEGILDAAVFSPVSNVIQGSCRHLAHQSPINGSSVQRVLASCRRPTRANKSLPPAHIGEARLLFIEVTCHGIPSCIYCWKKVVSLLRIPTIRSCPLSQE